MKEGPTGFQWAVTVCSFAILMSLISYPATLPSSVKRGTELAVDGVTRFFLRMEGEALIDEVGAGIAGYGQEAVWQTPGAVSPPGPGADTLHQPFAAMMLKTDIRDRVPATRPAS